jgi:hypothetical protein
MSCAVHADVTRLRHIRYQLVVERTVSPQDVAWLISQLEATEEWRHKEIVAANDAYLRVHRMGPLHVGGR